MSAKEFICITCPRGCMLNVSEENGEVIVSGNFCKRGEVYGKQEMINPKRNISSTVKVNNGFLNFLPVKTSDTISKDLIFDVMNEINKVSVDAPISIGQVIIKNVLNTGVDIVATRNINLK